MTTDLAPDTSVVGARAIDDAASRFYTVGGFTLDDTVLPSGEVRWSAPGGNALYSAIGAWLWGAEVGIVARVSTSYPEQHLQLLREKGFDLQGVQRVEHPDFHVWILHEGDGKRQIIYRLDSGSNTYLDPTPAQLPSPAGQVGAMHICPIRRGSQEAFVQYGLANGIPLYLDLIVIPGQIDQETTRLPEAWKRLRAFLPSIEEVRTIWGARPLIELCEELRLAGPPCIAVKMGQLGSLVLDIRNDAITHVPACQTEAIDATGAGDAYCGGFMVGLKETGDPVEAAMRGTVSASFVIEDFGALHALYVPPARVHARLEKLRSGVRRLSLAELASLA